MKVIQRSKIDRFRYAVAKITFSRINTAFTIIENDINSNLLLVELKNKNQVFYLSFLKQASVEIPEDFPVLIFYENHVKTKQEGAKGYDFKEELKILETIREPFRTQYRKNLEEAFLRSQVFFETLKQDERALLDGLFMKKQDLIKTMYKYRSKTSMEQNTYGVLDGQLAFSSPLSFNDPFDCNLYFRNNAKMADLFRVLCLSTTEKNVLMWSYYADSHTGYCVEYKSSSILESIENSPFKGLCVVGEVTYQKRRPAIKTFQSQFSYTDIKFYIDAAFTKFQDWEHEKEYRFVMILEDFYSNQMPSHLSIYAEIEAVYVGVNNLSKNAIDQSGNRTIRLEKDERSYALIEKTD